MDKGLARPIGVVLFVICMVGISSVALAWDCRGDCDNYYHHWISNTERDETEKLVCWTGVKGDQESADFICVCHAENPNPKNDTWDAYGDCEYYGPLEYGYAYNEASYYVKTDPEGEYEYEGTFESWIYTD